MRSLCRSILALVPIGLVVSACSDATGSGKVPLTLSISTRQQAAALALAATGPAMATTAANALVITKAQVVMDEIELKSSSASTCSGLAAEDAGTTGSDDCEELHLDPMLVDLPVDGITQLDLGTLVPAGTYNELEFKIDAVESGEHASAAAFLAAHPDFGNVAVRVEGTYNGQPFVFVSREDVHFEMEFASPMTVGGGSSNLTVAIDVASWFRNAAGTDVLNPADPANASLIANNIKASFHAFEDDDHDGTDDHETTGTH